MRINGQKFLVVYSGVLTTVVSIAALSGFTTESGASGGNARFDTITVQRINVVEPDGTLRMVLTNNKKIPAIIVEGHEYSDFTGRRGSTEAGIYFYDAKATEAGGLTWGGPHPTSGIKRWGHLAFDRFNQDQMFSLLTRDDGTNFFTQLRTIDQPNWNIAEYLQLEERIKDLPEAEQTAARNEFWQTHAQGAGIRTLLSSENYPDAPASSRNVLLFNDPARQNRTRLGIDSQGVGALEFLDPTGTVTHKYPPPQ
jgi:hypothetical protein